MCDQLYNNYVEELNSSTDLATSEPYPIITFSPSCFSPHIFTSNGVYAVPGFVTYGIVIPSNKVLVCSLLGEFPSDNIITLEGPLSIPVLTNFPSPFFVYPDNKNNIEGTLFYKCQDKDNVSWQQQQLNACMGTPLEIYFQNLISYIPESNNCDRAFAYYCRTNTANVQGCPPKVPGPYTGDPRCTCFHEEICLNIETSGADNELGVTLPVACFGKGCGATGYRTAQMQQENCSATFCDNFVKLNGSDLYVAGNVSIYCGNVTYTLTPPPSTMTPSETPVPKTSLPLYGQVLIGVFGSLLLIILIYVIGKFGAHWW
jgi:hypothetical protein